MLSKFLNPYSEHIYAALRVVAGFLWMCHGAQKIFGVLGGRQNWAGPMRVTGGFVELIGGAFIAIGLLTTVWAFLASGQMAVAYFRSHAVDGFWPIQNGGELAALYCFLFLYVAAHGAGLLSLDRLLKRTDAGQAATMAKRPVRA
jgi:putative oxidoreductase